MKELMGQKEWEELEKIASDLVKIPSYSFLENSEKAVAEYIFKLLRAEGIEAELTEVLDGRPNVHAVIRGCGGGSSLMLSGHLDTVPPYGMENPFGGEIKEGILYGRGACDMKGAVASMLCAILALKREGVRLKGDLIFTGVIDEEEKGKGIQELIKHGPYADAAIIGEGTDLRIAVGNKGLEWIEIIIYGKTVHGGAAKEGINAISKAAKLITRLESDYIPRFACRKHAVLGEPALNFGVIAGGDQPSTVAGFCSIKVDRRWVPGETKEQVYQEIRQVIKELHREDSDFKAEIHDVFEGDGLMEHRPFLTEESDPVVVASKEAMDVLEKEKGIPFNQETTTLACWTDAGYLSNFTDTSCIILGPGNISYAHTAEDRIPIVDLVKASVLYKEIAEKYCGVL
ncbi:MAG: M20 family metallopeptidase [Anaerovoracaceae bacterium]